jgi:ABC-type sugar transport system substrate-binding protein
MKKLNFVVSLITNDNDFQMEQAAAAEETSRRLGVGLQILYADGDTILQSQQLLEIIQSRSDSHPDGIIIEPVGGTALPQVARASVAAGIGWVVINREADYLSTLRKSYRVPAFAVSSNHEEIGRIQSRQFGALLPKGGSVLYIQGPSETTAAKLRATGMYEAKPANVDVKAIRGSWTEASGHKAVSSWLRLSTSYQSHMDLIAAQNDAMAVGAKKAFQEVADSAARDRWLNVPFIGCDGVPKTGQAWVRSGLLAATVIAPPLTGQAMEMMVNAIQSGNVPSETTFVAPRSYPPIENLESVNAERAKAFAQP